MHWVVGAIEVSKGAVQGEGLSEEVKMLAEITPADYFVTLLTCNEPPECIIIKSGIVYITVICGGNFYAHLQRKIKNSR